jgi:hypothetical protein
MMKKILFAFTLMLGLMSCKGNVTPNTEDATDSLEVVVDSAVVDTTAVDTVSVDTISVDTVAD